MNKTKKAHLIILVVLIVALAAVTIVHHTAEEPEDISLSEPVVSAEPAETPDVP